KRPQCQHVLDAVAAISIAVDAALPPCDRAHALVCASVCLAAATFGMDSAYAISVGGLATACDCDLRKGGIWQFLFRPLFARPRWRWQRSCQSDAGQCARSWNAPHSRCFPDRPGPVDRARRRGNLPHPRRSPAAFSRAALIRVVKGGQNMSTAEMTK